MCFVRCFKASDLRHLLARDREKHSKNETSLTNWSADWQLYWLIFNRALLRWEGADIRPNSIWPNSILTLIFVFLHAQIFVAQRRQKKTPETHTNQLQRWSSDSPSSQSVCATVCGELGWLGLFEILRYNTAIYGEVWRLPFPTDYIIMLRALMCFSQMLRLRQREAGTFELHRGQI